MDIRVSVTLENGTAYMQRIHLQEEVPLSETENVLRNAFKIVIRDIAKLREVKNNGN